MLGVSVVTWCCWLSLTGIFVLRTRLQTLGTMDDVLRIALAGLFANLLAAGGMSFPNLLITMGAILACVCPCPRALDVPSWLRRFALPALAVVGWCVLQWTTYLPVLSASARETESLATQGKIETMVAALQAASDADPLSFDLALERARLRNQWFLEQPTKTRFRLVQEDFAEAIAKNRRSYAPHALLAEASAEASRLLADRSFAKEAVEHFQAAIERYPNSNVLHAELAIALTQSGDEQAAAREAREALRLDDLTPHADKKLARIRLGDQSNQSLDDLAKQLAK
jgi:tetratricopeptide (TPR) repeat protein